MKSIIIASQYGARNKRLKRKEVNYREFLKSNIWMETKDYLRTFPEFNLCSICKGIDNLVFHHMSYRRIFNSNLRKRKEDLVCLCNLCHYNIHELVKSKNYGLRQGVRKYRKLWVSRETNKAGLVNEEMKL